MAVHGRAVAFLLRGFRRHGWHGLSRGDTGTTVVTTAIVAGTLMVVLLIVIQFVLIFHARQVATAAAQDGLRAGQSANATPTDASNAATAFAARDHTLSPESPEVDEAGGQLTVVVKGTAPSLVPGLPAPHVRGVAAGPIEQPLTPGQR
jgi:Flp pilus assembly protein TadG